MTFHAYVGNTFESPITLRTPSLVVDSLSNSNPAEWNAPTKFRLVDESGTIWYEEHLPNPEPRILGSELAFDYDVSLVIPEMESGNYILQLSRWTVSTSINIEIEGLARQAYGAEDSIGLITDSNIQWQLVDPNPNAVVTWEFGFRRVTGGDAMIRGGTNKTLMGSDAVYVSNYAFSPSQEGLMASLTPAPIIWSIEDTPGVPPKKQTSLLFIVNYDQLGFITELKGFFDRLCEERRLPELEYTMADYAKWAQQGMGMFNSGGLFTSFTMTQATDAIRYWWSICSIICALRNMYMLEGQRSFSFSGQSVSLDVDITQYLESLKSDLLGQWDSDKLSFKQQLKSYGMTGGNGNMANARFQAGSLGLSLGPASNLGGYYFGRSFFNGLRMF